MEGAWSEGGIKNGYVLVALKGSCNIKGNNVGNWWEEISASS